MSRKAYFVTQVAGAAALTPEDEERLRAQVREQMRQAVPVVILPVGRGVVEVEACEPAPEPAAKPKKG